MRKAPRRGLRLAKFQFLLFLLVCFLLPDVIADDLFRHTDGADAVPACPTVVAREVALPPQILPMNADRRSSASAPALRVTRPARSGPAAGEGPDPPDTLRLHRTWPKKSSSRDFIF